MRLVVLAALILAGSASSQAVRQFGEVRKTEHVPRLGGVRAFLLGDYDRDGALDVVTPVGGAAPWMLKNLGGLRFANQVFGQSLRGYVTGGVSGDFDKDGDVDVVLTCVPPTTTNGQDLFFENNGRGLLIDTTSTRFPTRNDQTLCVAAGDVDGDGDLDLVFGCGDWHGRAGQQNKLWLNDGKGRFVDRSNLLPRDSDISNAVALGDVNGDGRLDIVFANGHRTRNRVEQNRVYFNQGGARFVDGTSGALPKRAGVTLALALADIDNNRTLDLVFAEAGAFGGAPDVLLLGDGRGRFRPATTPLPGAPIASTAIAIEDVDADGRVDVLIGASREPLRLLRNLGSAKFQDVSAAWFPHARDCTASLLFADLDNDGRRELLAADACSAMRLYVRAGKRFVDATAWSDLAGATHANLNGPSVSVVGRIDTDPWPDLIVTGANTSVLINDGSGGFRDETAARLGQTRLGISDGVAGDLDKDGDEDFVVTRRGATDLIVENRAGKLVPRPLGSATHDSLAVELGDVDGDGDLDIAIAVRGGRNRLLINRGRLNFVDETTTRMPADADHSAALALVDLDGDRDLDMIVANGESAPRAAIAEQNRVYINDGKGRFSDGTSTWLPQRKEATVTVAVGDVDKDGDVDVVFGNSGRVYLGPFGGDRVLLQNRKRLVDHAQLKAADTQKLALVDVDEDGKLDLLTQPGDFPLGQVRVALGDGRGNFVESAKRSDRLAHGVLWGSSLRVADFDADGDQDLVVAAALYFNKHRHAEAKSLARIGNDFVFDVITEPGYGTQSMVAVPIFGARKLHNGIRVGSFGILRLNPGLLIAGSAVPTDRGLARIGLPIPRTASLVGVELLLQAALLPSSNPNAARLTRLIEEPILR